MEMLLLFLAASVALIITPGPDSIYVLSRGVSEGRSAGIVSALGVSCGLMVHTLAAALGLAILLKTSMIAFWTLKIIGGVYLIYLGFKMLKNKNALDIQFTSGGLDIKKCFAQGFLTNVLNPKVALFFVAFLPQFVSATHPNYSLRIILLGCAFTVLTIIYLGCLGMFAGFIGGWLRSKEGLSRKISCCSGAALILLGSRILLPEKS
ncbi:LysE family translocator [Lentisphaerota bacterium ZTH]|nr:LysE family translocator [Lentisphaerota bacterium]WET06409.1 LysE family translocator [Lentisphaerota bacterium ZTH]